MRPLFLAISLTLFVLGDFPVCRAQINVDVHLDREQYLAGEPAYLVWEYTNNGSTAVPFDRVDPYCEEPTIEAPSLPFASPPVFPYPLNGIIDCVYLSRPLAPGERYVSKYLLNHRFILNKAGRYEITVPPSTREASERKPILNVGASLLPAPNLGETSAYSLANPDGGAPHVKLTLVLQASSEEGLRKAYRPYFNALTTPGSIDRADALRALADSGEEFTEIKLLQISSDPRDPLQGLADEGLARLRTPAACARLAELAAHPELHQQQWSIEQLGRCGDPEYMMFLFNLTYSDPSQRQFALRAAAEAGGNAAIDRLLMSASQGSLDREAALYALGLTGSERAVNVLIDALPSLPDSLKFTALASLRTLTHRESKQKSYDAQIKQWQQWRAIPGTKKIYKPRDWSTETAPLELSAEERFEAK